MLSDKKKDRFIINQNQTDIRLCIDSVIQEIVNDIVKKK